MSTADILLVRYSFLNAVFVPRCEKGDRLSVDRGCRDRLKRGGGYSSPKIYDALQMHDGRKFRRGEGGGWF